MGAKNVGRWTIHVEGQGLMTWNPNTSMLKRKNPKRKKKPHVKTAEPKNS